MLKAILHTKQAEIAMCILNTSIHMWVFHQMLTQCSEQYCILNTFTHMRAYQQMSTRYSEQCCIQNKLKQTPHVGISTDVNPMLRAMLHTKQTEIVMLHTKQTETNPTCGYFNRCQPNAQSNVAY